MTTRARSQPIAGIVLAAGRSRRFGRPKQLLELEGEPLIRRTARIARQAGLDPVVVVVSATEAPVMRQALAGLAVQVAMNERPEAGMGRSLALGLAACPAEAAAVVVLVCDQPGLEPWLLHRLIEAWRRGAGGILRPRCGERPGHPVLFDARLLPRRTPGDEGAPEPKSAGEPLPRGRDLIAAHPGELFEVEIEDPRTIHDVDRVEDWEAFRQRF